MTDPESTAIDPVAAMATDHTEAPAHPLHKVLSFVRRSGRLDDRLQRAWDNYADTYLLDIAAGNLLDVREGVTLDRAFVESHGATTIRSLWKSAPAGRKRGGSSRSPPGDELPCPRGL